jgi:hypothetical protein
MEKEAGGVMKFLSAGLVLAAVTVMSPLSARTLSFPPQNFECEVADSWTLLSSTGACVMATDRGGNKLTITTQLRDVTLSLDSPAFLQDATLLVESLGYQVDQRRGIKLEGQHFQEWRLSSSGTSSQLPTLARFILADGYLYQIALSSPDDPSQHSDLMAMGDSFRFIHLPHIHLASSFGDSLTRGATGDYSDSPDHPGSILPFVGGLCLFAFLPILGIVGAIWAIKQEEKPKRSTKGNS